MEQGHLEKQIFSWFYLFTARLSSCSGRAVASRFWRIVCNNVYAISNWLKHAKPLSVKTNNVTTAYKWIYTITGSVRLNLGTAVL